MNFAWIFPGQGAQTPGFLHTLPEHTAVQETLREASEYLHRDVLELDSEESLSSTIATQLALLVAGVAFVRFFTSAGVDPPAVAGMSVGAYPAAVAAGCLDLPSALCLVQRRAELMQAAFPQGTYGMAVIEGLRLHAIKSLLNDTEISIANYNSATQFVLAGTLRELAALLERAIEAGAHTAKLLPMATASHTPILREAAQHLLMFSRELRLEAPRIPIYSNITARRMDTAVAVGEDLAWNMAYPVRWYDMMSALASLNGDGFLEAPPGHALTRLNREIVPEAIAIASAENRWDVTARKVLGR